MSEELKLAILRVAMLRHRTSRTNHCKNFFQFLRDPTSAAGGLHSPTYDEPNYPHWSPSHKRNKLNLTVPATPLEFVDRRRLGLDLGDDSRDRDGDGTAHSSIRTRSGTTTEPLRRLSGTTPPIPPPQYDYFLRRLEEKIMDRMKVQMDTLYKRIEDRMMEMK